MLMFNFCAAFLIFGKLSVIAGLCACLLEYRPMERGELIGLLHASGTRAAAPGCELGYGIPQTDVLLRMLRTP